MKTLKPIGINQFPFSGLLHKLVPSHRNRMFDEFVKFKNDDVNVTTLNIAAEEQDQHGKGNYVFTWNTRHGQLKTMRARFNRSGSGMLFTWDASHDTMPQQLTSENLPFDDAAFDWIFCEAVIEHVGNAERQYLLIKELMRVARKGIFVTTSNRWHPFEFYTALPFLHWLPSSAWKRLLKFMGKEGWASGSMLNLLDAKALQGFVNRLPQKPECSIGHVRVMGLKAYFFLQIKKHDTPIRVDSPAAAEA